MITREEYGLLKNYRDKGYGWIARDRDEYVYVYKSKPKKLTYAWWGLNIDEMFDSVCDDDYLFQYIKWEDEKPTKILDLIQDYEKQEELKKKVVIPQFVADWIEDIKPDNSLRVAFEYIAERKADNHDDPLALWIEEGNSETFAIAWLYGYVVEKEKLYTVRLANGDCLFRFKSLGIDWAKGQDYRNDPGFQLTQSEIESVDKRLMQFAVEVEQ